MSRDLKRQSWRESRLLRPAIDRFAIYGNSMEIISHGSPASSFAPFFTGFVATWLDTL